MTGTIAAVVFLTLVVSLVLTVPIGFSLGIASLGYILYTGQLTTGFIAQNMVTGCDSFPTMAIPFFIFAGELMGGGGISKRLLNLANVFFGRITGGLAIVTVVVCMFFAAISGSGPATVAAVGGMVVPTMLEKGYDKKFVLALIAAAGSIGVIILYNSTALSPFPNIASAIIAQIAECVYCPPFSLTPGKYAFIYPGSNLLFSNGGSSNFIIPFSLSTK